MKSLFGEAEIDCYRLDIYFPTGCFDRIVKQRQNHCFVFFENCNSLADLPKFFTQTMLKSLFQFFVWYFCRFWWYL